MGRRAGQRALLLGVLAVGGACGGGAGRPADVILITIDTLRADRLGLYGYERETTPAIDRWFGDGTVFLRSYSTEASTSPSVASILSGQLPQDHRVRLFYQLVPAETELIPDLLPEAYQTAAFVSNMVLTDDAMGWGSRFDHFDDFVDERESVRAVYQRDARRTTDAAVAWLEQHRDPDRPLFLWVHYIDPHGPYRPPADWGVRFRNERSRTIPIERVPFYTREPGLTDGYAYVDRYDSEVAFVDSQVGRLLERYAALHPIEESLVVLTADHGESMMEHESWFTHGYHVYDEIVHVPLLLRGPGVEARRVEVPVSGIDVATTVLRFAGRTPPASLGGADLRFPATLDPERTVFAEAGQKEHQWRTAVRGERKWIVAVQGPERRIVTQALFDLSTDPGELAGRPLDPQDSLARDLLERIQTDPDPAGIPADFQQGIRLAAPKVAPGVDEDQLEALRRLGYAE